MDSAWTALDVVTQTMFHKAIDDPKSVDLEKLTIAIVDQSLKDISFCKDAGRMCYAVVQAEAQKAATSVFRRNLLTRLQQEFTAREETRNRSVQEWVCLVTFICSIFDYIKVNNAPLVALVDPVYDCLYRLAKPDALINEEELESSPQNGGRAPEAPPSGCYPKSIRVSPLGLLYSLLHFSSDRKRKPVLYVSHFAAFQSSILVNSGLRIRVT
uniref:MIF4G domain containing a n=1 Tax=Cyprinus carpio carpio TaxID=630221 RepID=A0A9J8C4P7_CYPCA